MDKRLIILLAGHAALDAVLLAFLCLGYRQAHYALLTFISAQVTLIGIWVGLSQAACPLRVAAGILAIPGLSLISTARIAAFRGAPELLTMGLQMAASHATALTSAAVITFAFRLRRMQFRQWEEADSLPAAPALQFSIGHLLTLTFAVAVVMAIVSQVWGHLEVSLHRPVRHLTLVALKSTVAALLGVWAALMLGRLPLRIGIALIVSAALGVLFTFVWGNTSASLHFRQSAIVLATLLVVRSCGYRLSRAPGATEARPLRSARNR